MCHQPTTMRGWRLLPNPSSPPSRTPGHGRFRRGCIMRISSPSLVEVRRTTPPPRVARCLLPVLLLRGVAGLGFVGPVPPWKSIPALTTRADAEAFSSFSHMKQKGKGYHTRTTQNGTSARFRKATSFPSLPSSSSGPMGWNLLLLSCPLFFFLWAVFRSSSVREVCDTRQGLASFILRIIEVLGWGWAGAGELRNRVMPSELAV